MLILCCMLFELLVIKYFVLKILCYILWHRFSQQDGIWCLQQHIHSILLNESFSLGLPQLRWFSQRNWNFSYNLSCFYREYAFSVDVSQSKALKTKWNNCWNLASSPTAKSYSSMTVYIFICLECIAGRLVQRRKMANVVLIWWS